MSVRHDCMSMILFFFNHTATTEIYTLSLHDALPILAVLLDLQLSPPGGHRIASVAVVSKEQPGIIGTGIFHLTDAQVRSEEHTSELQSQSNLVCRLLLEKKKKKPTSFICFQVR